MAPSKPPARAAKRSDEDERFPNLAAQRDWDRAEHVNPKRQSTTGPIASGS